MIFRAKISQISNKILYKNRRKQTNTIITGYFEPKKLILTYQNFHIMPDLIKNDQRRFECFFDDLDIT